MAYSRAFGKDVIDAIGSRSQREVAIEMGVSPTTLSNMVVGRIPEHEVLVKFARAIRQPLNIWEDKARKYSTEAYLRTTANLSEKKLEILLEIIEKTDEEVEREYGKK